ncbi:L,D-transpeptidase [Streptomyces sp. NPDC001941]|uniref:L,D-transpeptidase n=1 Tax=Streptomyces sp. NPDC001941 TaxID=3154659 RepID=UPI003319B6EA
MTQRGTRRVLVTLLFLTMLAGNGAKAATHTTILRNAPSSQRQPVLDVEASPPYESRKRAPFCTTYTGPHQMQMEKYLHRKADGKQDIGDCRAIQRFQQLHRIRPDIGYAGPVTYATTVLLSALNNPDPDGRCPRRASLVVCVDLTRQLLWVEKGKMISFLARPIRSGARDYRTRTGWFRISWRNKNHFSTIYRTPMPYAQFFTGGQAFHAYDGSVYAPPGSHGCVNMRSADARGLWGHVQTGTLVYVYGRKPGT